jgi:hypothetical protein
MAIKARLRLNPDHPEWRGGTTLQLVAQTEKDAAEGIPFGRWSVRAPLTQKLRDGEEDVVRLSFLVRDPIEGIEVGSTIRLFGGTKCIAEGVIVSV